MDAFAFGGSLGLGVGVLVIDSSHGLVSGNTATGLGDAETDVLAESDIPLTDAYAFSLATGIGKGIAVLFSHKTDVVRCNTAAGEGRARVYAEYDADFGAEGAAGFSGSYDILMKLMWNDPPFGVVNYNSMVDATPLAPGNNDGPVFVMDAGLLKIGKGLNARWNWWNHPTGPSGMGPGNGEPVLRIGPPVNFVPWLYVVHTEVLDEQIGKFGFYIPMTKGLNTFSTPIALDESALPSRQWGHILTNNPGLPVLWIDRWDSSSQSWQSVAAGDDIDPLHAYYIYMLAPSPIILYVNSSDGHPYAMPVRGTVIGPENPNPMTVGWNLIAPNPVWPPWPGMPVRPATTSILLTPAGLPGLTQVISPNVFSQPAWAWVPTMPGPGPLMGTGRGYWVWMENPDTLVGFGFSPIPAGP